MYNSFKLPIVVRTVTEKKIDCPKLQFGSDIVTFPVDKTPLWAALLISIKNFSRASSKRSKDKFSIYNSLYIYIFIKENKHDNVESIYMYI
jgi:hypothetical protein